MKPLNTLVQVCGLWLAFTAPLLAEEGLWLAFDFEEGLNPSGGAAAENAQVRYARATEAVAPDGSAFSVDQPMFIGGLDGRGLSLHTIVNPKMQRMVIGRWGKQGLCGTLDNLKIYSRALSPAEVRQACQEGKKQLRAVQ